MATQVKGEWVVGLNPDDRMPNDWLRMVARVFAAFRKAPLESSIVVYIDGLNISIDSYVNDKASIKITPGQAFVDDQFIGFTENSYLNNIDTHTILNNEKDLKIDVYRSSGHGGQSVNTTDSAVRITHLPTGMVVICQDEKSQLKNKNKAMKVLRSRLLDLEIAKQEAEIANSRRSQVGTGDRSAKIRTYNFPQSRVTDHRINLTSYKLNNILTGELDEFIDALRIAYKNEKLQK